MESTDEVTELLSIGDVAEATGLSVDTIRVWERRYERPRPVRLPSGHRRYTREHLRWLRRVAEALAAGHRPSKVVPLSEDALDAILAPEESEADESGAGALLDLVREFRAGDLREELRRGLAELGYGRFLRRGIAPLVTLAGRSWADGELEVRHEHFLTVVLEDFLRAHRLTLPEGTGPIVLLTTLTGETHGLGLQMAALVATLAGARGRVLGPDSPNEEIEAAAHELGARVVAISVSLATGGVATDRVLADLRRRLPPEVSLVIGGRGARGVRRGPRGVDYVEDLTDFERYLKAL